VTISRYSTENTLKRLAESSRMDSPPGPYTSRTSSSISSLSMTWWVKQCVLRYPFTILSVSSLVGTSVKVTA